MSFQMRSDFHETFLFLTRLCWKNRVVLPAMISVAFLVFNFRWQVEISIQTERIPMPVNVNHEHDESPSESDYTSNEEYELASTTTDDDSSDDLIFC